MSVKYATPLLLDLQPSVFVKGYLLCVYLLAMLSVLILPMAAHLQMLLLVLLVFSCLHSYRRHNQGYHLVWSDTDWIVRHGGAEYNAVLLPSSVVTARLTILNFRLQTRQRMSLLLLPDSVDANQFRRLRVRLKVCATKTLAHAKISL